MVNLNVGFAPLAGNIIGKPALPKGRPNYTNTRFALTLEWKVRATMRLPWRLCSSGRRSHVDHDTSDDPSGSGSATVIRSHRKLRVLLTTGQAKAMGFSVNPSTSDASITFNSNLPFDFCSRSGGRHNRSGFLTISLGVATHEIGPFRSASLAAWESVDVSPWIPRFAI